MSDYYAVIEAGGTKFNCAIVNAEREILVEQRVATTTPEVTLGEVVRFFKLQKAAGFNFDCLGLACFGPLDLHHDSASYGSITATPKAHWSNIAIVSLLEQSLNCRVEFDTDVNAAALAEHRWGAAQGADVCIYVTVGTGIGGGVVINGKPLHGLIHPEIGHMLIPAPEGIEGVCPFHGNCVEGLASGKAMGEIWQQPAEILGDDHKAWDIQAQVLGLMCHNLLVSFSPQRIVLGGGVMNKPGLLEKVINYTEQSLTAYLQMPMGKSLEDVICLPDLDQHSGLLGALTLLLAD
jgi:fructokinase